ncbi:unnamed protein product [Dicrocoelium dendriticum]|nr:unnamed protein product [Dicrocoelium dendriticum]
MRNQFVLLGILMLAVSLVTTYTIVDEPALDPMDDYVESYGPPRYYIKRGIRRMRMGKRSSPRSQKSDDATYSVM